MTLISLTAAGCILTLSITGLGVIVKGFVNKSHISEKVEKCKFAYQSYGEVCYMMKKYYQTKKL